MSRRELGLNNTFANSVDPDETAHDEPSNQHLHWLPFRSWFTTVSLLAAVDLYKCRDGRVYFRNSGLKDKLQPSRQNAETTSAVYQRWINVESTLIQLCVPTLNRRCSNVVCLLGMLSFRLMALQWAQNDPQSNKNIQTFYLALTFLNPKFLITKTRLFKYIENFTT